MEDEKKIKKEIQSFFEGLSKIIRKMKKIICKGIKHSK
jgi:hypothetical protein